MAISNSNINIPFVRLVFLPPSQSCNKVPELIHNSQVAPSDVFIDYELYIHTSSVPHRARFSGSLLLLAYNIYVKARFQTAGPL